MYKRQVFFKCENFQSSGSFKYRAALNAIKSIPNDFKKRGVITHSSGNFAHALSRASHELNIPCYIIMPYNTPDFIKDSGTQDRIKYLREALRKKKIFYPYYYYN